MSAGLASSAELVQQARSELHSLLHWVQVAEALSKTKESAVVAHARDELGIDVDDAPSPTQV